MKIMRYLILGGVIVLGIPFTSLAYWHGNHSYGGHGYHSYNYGGNGYHSYGGNGYHTYGGGYSYHPYGGSGFYGGNAIHQNLRAIRRDQYLVNFAGETEATRLRKDIDRRVHFLRNNFGIEVP